MYVNDIKALICSHLLRLACPSLRIMRFQSVIWLLVALLHVSACSRVFRSVAVLSAPVALRLRCRCCNDTVTIRWRCGVLTVTIRSRCGDDAVSIRWWYGVDTVTIRCRCVCCVECANTIRFSFRYVRYEPSAALSRWCGSFSLFTNTCFSMYNFNKFFRIFFLRYMFQCIWIAQFFEKLNYSTRIYLLFQNCSVFWNHFFILEI